MNASEAYEYASSWGSYIRSGDPGACMYGYNANCRPQNEAHRQETIQYMKGCRQYVEQNPDQYDEDELEKMDDFLEYIASVQAEDHKEKFIIELSLCGSVSCCRMDGSVIESGTLLHDNLMDCTRGDVEDACKHVLAYHEPEFRIVRRVRGEYQNVLASAQEKTKICRTVYCDSSTDFKDEKNAEMYLVWEAAAQLEMSMVESE